MRELYLNVDLKGVPKDSEFYYDDELDQYVIETNEDRGFNLGVDTVDVDTYIKCGMVREVLPKWADDDSALELLKYYWDYKFDEEPQPVVVALKNCIKEFKKQKGII